MFAFLGENLLDGNSSFTMRTKQTKPICTYSSSNRFFNLLLLHQQPTQASQGGEEARIDYCNYKRRRASIAPPIIEQAKAKHFHEAAVQKETYTQKTSTVY